MMMFQMLEPGSTIKSIPLSPSSTPPTDWIIQFSVPLFKPLMKISKRTGPNRGPLIQGDIYSSMFLVNCYWLLLLTTSFYLCSKIVCLIKARRWLGSSPQFPCSPRVSATCAGDLNLLKIAGASLSGSAFTPSFGLLHLAQLCPAHTQPQLLS